MNKLIGIDGCKFGWIAVSTSDSFGQLFKTLNELVSFYDDQTIFLVDMPIGLSSEKVERTCDRDARKELSPKRRSSIFPIPCRKAIYAENYELANRINRDVLQKGLSKQSWFICSKIRELDHLLLQDENLRLRLKESHPELAFHHLNQGISMEFNKKTEEGQKERLSTLLKFSQNISDIHRKTVQKFTRTDVAKDDILDALCLAVTLEEMIKNNISLESSQFDEKGLGMKINVFSTLDIDLR